MAENNMRFEDALARLEELTEKLEAGNVSLDDSLSYYEEGMRLIRLCNGRLDEAEARILAVQKTQDGSVEVPFDEVKA